MHIIPNITLKIAVIFVSKSNQIITEFAKVNIEIAIKKKFFVLHMQKIKEIEKNIYATLINPIRIANSCEEVTKSLKYGELSKKTLEISTDIEIAIKIKNVILKLKFSLFPFL